MKALNKIVAYSTSSIWLLLIVTLTINYKILNNSVFWTGSIAMCLPFGIIIECFYSIIYKYTILWIINKIILKFCSKYKDSSKYFFYNKELLYKDKIYQEFLSENNIIRNFWMSSLCGLVFIFFYKVILNNNINTLYETKIVYWLPIILILAVIANIRLEVCITRRKYEIYSEQIIDPKKLLECSHNLNKEIHNLN